ncbi:hypothetical protein FAI41_01740 [Acetobacteraceae bacterium]|nr:hypothetical protein FAI41_01740 [Acetobacteraceae bacterium]
MLSKTSLLLTSFLLFPLSVYAQSAATEPSVTASTTQVSAVSAASKGSKEITASDSPPALLLKADLKDGRGVQTKITLTLKTTAGETLNLHAFKHTDIYMSALHEERAAIAQILTKNAWTSDTGTRQQVAYPGFQLTPSPDSNPNIIIANAGNGECKLPLHISTLHPDENKETITLHFLPDLAPHENCATYFPHLSEVTAIISAEAYEYKVPANPKAAPVLFFLRDGMFNISSNPLLMPRDVNDLGIYRYTLSVHGEKTAGNTDPGVHLEEKDLISNAIVFSGFALWGNHSFTQAVSQMSIPWLSAWLSDMAAASPYFCDGIIYKNLKGQQIQFVYYPAEDGKSFQASEMTFLPNGELEELCHYPLEYENAEFVQGQTERQSSRVIVNFTAKKDPTANESSCSGIPMASYPSKLSIAILPEVTETPEVKNILNVK